MNRTHIPGVGAVKCGRCKACGITRVNDVVGRALAEAEVSDLSVSLTLTYRDDALKSDFLQPRDFQKAMQALQMYGRRNGFRVRYIVAGEYGHRKGRPHFHCIAFFRGRNLPEFKFREQRWTWKHWPHGYTYADEASPQSFNYVCKYLLKESTAKLSHQTTTPQAWFSRSLKPALGSEWFEQLAERYAAQGLAPSSWWYAFADHRTRKGKPWHYYLRGSARDDFLAAYARAWRERYGDRPFPASPVIEDWQDREARRDPLTQMRRAVSHVRAKAAPIHDTNLADTYYGRVHAVTADRFITRRLPGIVVMQEFDPRRPDRGLWSPHLLKERELVGFRQIRSALRGEVDFAPIHTVRKPAPDTSRRRSARGDV